MRARRTPRAAQINGEELTATALLCYFKSYTALYAAGDLPEPKTVVNATAEANNAAAKASAFKQYTRMMERQCSTKRMLSDEQFAHAHQAAVQAAMDAFESTKRMGSAELKTKFKEHLVTEISDSHKFFHQTNRLKNMIGAFKTPIVLTVAMVLGIVLGWFMNRLWLESLASACYNVALVAFTAFLMWMINVAQECQWEFLNSAVSMIDSAAEQVWNTLRQKGIGVIADQAKRAKVD